jgi:hypothetical protein
MAGWRDHATGFAASAVGRGRGAIRSLRRGAYADAAYSAGLTRGTFRSPQYWSMAKFGAAGAAAGASVGGASAYYSKDRSVASGMMTGALYGAGIGGIGRGGAIAGRSALGRRRGRANYLQMNTIANMDLSSVSKLRTYTGSY